MSTKIYGGMIATVGNPFTLQRKIRRVVQPIFFDNFERNLDAAAHPRNAGKTWVETFELISLGTDLEEKFNRPIGAGRWNIARDLYELVLALQKTSVRTLSELDFGYEVVVMPNGCGINKNSLVLLFSENSRVYTDALLDDGVVAEYGYWDNSDKPRKVSKEEWRERERAWSKVDVPSQDGFLIPIPSDMDVSIEMSHRSALKRIAAKIAE